MRTIHVRVPHDDWQQHAGRAPSVDGVTFDVQTYRRDEAVPACEVLVPYPAGDRGRVLAALETDPPRLLQLMSAGFDWLAGRVPDGTTVCNAGDVHSPAVAEWVVTALLAQVRELPRFAAAAARGRWQPGSTGTLDGATVVVLGFGSIGRALQARLEPFGVTVVGVGRSRLSSLPSLLPDAAALVVLTPLSDATRHQVDADLLAQLPDGAVVVNAARGPVVDTDALLAELRSGRLRASLDVTDPEPLPDDHPLFSAPGCLVTPHVAGSVSTFLPRAYAFVVEQLERYARGEQLAAVVRP